MSTYYLLNESSAPDKCGDMEVFATLELLVQDTEAIDVLNGEYFAYTTDGYRIILTAENIDSCVQGCLEPEKSSERVVLQLLTEYLLWAARDGRFDISTTSVEEAKSLEELTKIIPETLIRKGF